MNDMAAIDILISRILRKGYGASVDDGRQLLIHNSRKAAEIKKVLKSKEDLLWLRDKTGFKFGWIKVNSRTGEVLDYSTRDNRMSDLVAGEFL